MQTIKKYKQTITNNQKLSEQSARSKSKIKQTPSTLSQGKSSQNQSYLNISYDYDISPSQFSSFPNSQQTETFEGPSRCISNQSQSQQKHYRPRSQFQTSETTRAERIKLPLTPATQSVKNQVTSSTFNTINSNNSFSYPVSSSSRTNRTFNEVDKIEFINAKLKLEMELMKKTNELQTKETQVQQCQNQLEHFKLQVDIDKEKHQNLENEIREIKSKLRNNFQLQKQSSKINSQTIQELQKQLQIKSELIRKLQDENQKLKDQVSQCSIEEVQKLQELVTEGDLHLKSLKSEMNHLIKRNQTLEIQYEDLQQLRQTNQTYKIQIQDLKQKNEILQNKLRKQEDNYLTKKEQFDLQQQIQCLTDYQKLLTEENKQLRQDYSSETIESNYKVIYKEISTLLEEVISIKNGETPNQVVLGKHSTFVYGLITPQEIINQIRKIQECLLEIYAQYCGSQCNIQ